MTIAETAALVGAGSFAGGFLGALTGLGGGIVIVPLLTVVFGVDVHYAIVVSLVSVVDTSSCAAAAYVKEGYTNLRVGMLLEIATTTGALLGAYVAIWIAPNTIAILFACVLLFSTTQSVRPRSQHAGEVSDALATRLRLASTYPTPNGPRRYGV